VEKKFTKHVFYLNITYNSSFFFTEHSVSISKTDQLEPLRKTGAVYYQNDTKRIHAVPSVGKNAYLKTVGTQKIRFKGLTSGVVSMAAECSSGNCCMWK
jgi:hypothetical protein